MGSMYFPRRFLMGIGLLIALTACGAVTPAPPEPVEFIDPKGLFSVTYPGAFRRSDPKDSSLYAEQRAIPTTVYDAGRLAPTVAYSTILVTPLDDTLMDRFDPAGIVALFSNELKKRTKVLKEVPLTDPAQPGLSMTVEALQKGETSFTRIDYRATANYLFQVTLTTKSLEQLESPENQAFFTSFKLLPVSQ